MVGEKSVGSSNIPTERTSGQGTLPSTLFVKHLTMKGMQAGVHQIDARKSSASYISRYTYNNTNPLQTHWIAPFSFPQPTTSPPTQNGFNALGRFNPSILFSSPSPSCTPFSRRATSNRGIAAAVPFSVCANGSGASESVLGRYRIWRRRDW